MANLNFREDLELARMGETAVREFLEKNGCVFKSFNDDYKFDLKMTKKDKDITYEIKTDFKCAPLFDTGNLFVEYECRNKPSGIMVTEAEWYVNYFPYFNEFWFIKSKDLRKLISDNEFPVFIDAGDVNSETKGYLINRKKNRNHFHVYKNQTT